MDNEALHAISAPKWIVNIFRPGSGMIPLLALLLTFGIIACLSYWDDVWLSAEIKGWLSHQNGLTKFAFYSAAMFVVYIAATIIAVNVIAPIHFAIDPAYATERTQKSQVKLFKIGDRVRASDFTGEDRGTITRVDPAGESFDVMWDVDGHTNTLCYFDVELFKRVD